VARFDGLTHHQAYLDANVVACTGSGPPDTLGCECLFQEPLAEQREALREPKALVDRSRLSLMAGTSSLQDHYKIYYDYLKLLRKFDSNFCWDHEPPQKDLENAQTVSTIHDTYRRREEQKGCHLRWYVLFDKQHY